MRQCFWTFHNQNLFAILVTCQSIFFWPEVNVWVLFLSFAHRQAYGRISHQQLRDEFYHTSEVFRGKVLVCSEYEAMREARIDFDSRFYTSRLLVCKVYGRGKAELTRIPGVCLHKPDPRLAKGQDLRPG
jgi:hypothetical protein